MRTLCIGADIAWWGGGKSKQSQADHIWSGWVDATGCIAGIQHQVVNLQGSERIVSMKSPTVRRRDPEGMLLISAIDHLVEQRTAHDRILIALDAPLEANARPDDLPRKPNYKRGEKSGIRQRDCERELRQYLKTLSSIWAKDVRVQAGAPLAPRVGAIVKTFKDAGFTLGANGRNMSGRDLVEIFPSASIGVLGASGAYGLKTSKEIRRYKEFSRFNAPDEALSVALAPMLGFETCIGNQVREIATEIARKSAAQIEWKAGSAIRGKCYDDAIDAGIAFLTGVCLVLKTYRWLGDGSDGAILVPHGPETRTQ